MTGPCATECFTILDAAASKDLYMYIQSGHILFDILFGKREVRRVKNCDQGCENSRMFTLPTDLIPVNN